MNRIVNARSFAKHYSDHPSPKRHHPIVGTEHNKGGGGGDVKK